MKRKIALLFTCVLVMSTVAYALVSTTKDMALTPEIIIPGIELPLQPVTPISIDYLRSLELISGPPVIEETLSGGSNYQRYIASYTSEGYKVYGLLTVPNGAMPPEGFPAIVFDHGYIPPQTYETTSGYVAYVDYLARNGFVVFKIDFRGNGRSEGAPSGSYFSSAYTVDTINAVNSIQQYNKVDPDRIGAWGHSMSGNAVLRALLVSDKIKAGVIWAGAVYSYEDFAKYRISDNSYKPRPRVPEEEDDTRNRELSPEIQKLREDPENVDFTSNFWKSVSLTGNIGYLSAPIQIHHAENDSVVNIEYSRDLVKALDENSKTYEFYEYRGGGHNIESPYFEQAMRRTVDFFKTHL